MKRKVSLLFIILLTLSACSGGSKTEATTSEPVEQPATTAESQPMKGMHSMMQEMCPMHVDGTTMSMEKSADGMVMTFSNTANVAEVQKRTQMMVEHHTQMAGHHHNGEMPPFTLSAENTTDGARLTMTPVDSAQMTMMQDMMMKRHADQGDSPCPMAMMGMMSGE